MNIPIPESDINPAEVVCSRKLKLAVYCCFNSGERWLVLEVAFKMEKKRRGDWNHGAGRPLTTRVAGLFTTQ